MTTSIPQSIGPGARALHALAHAARSGDAVSRARVAELVRDALRACDGNRTRAAHAMGIAPRVLRSWLAAPETDARSLGLGAVVTDVPARSGRPPND